MDKKRSILNISIAISTKVICLVLVLLTRRFLIKYAGNDANGVFSLYTSIFGFLAVADLGVGTAINFSMYKPIVDGDNKKVSALYCLYKKVYLIIGSIIGVAGLVVMPFLPILAKGFQSDFNLYVTFLIMLVSVVLNYVYSCKTSLINAYKNNYITTLIYSFSSIIKNVLQIIVLIYTGSFEFYLLAGVISVLVDWLLTEIYTRKRYNYIISEKEKIDNETKNEIVKNTKAMFMHKIGAVLVNTFDSIIISAFIGVAILGKYTNYVTIMTAMTSVISLFFTPLTSIIGHLCAEGNKKEEKKTFQFMMFLNFALGIFFFLGYYAIIDDLVLLCFGDGLLMDKSVSLIITINYFIQFMRQTVLLYRDATGTFYYDRWKAFLEGIVNVVLSVAFVYWIGLVGVIVATILTNIFICHIVEPFILYKYGFKEKPTKYYVLNYSFIAIFLIAIIALHFSLQNTGDVWLNIVENGFIAVAIACVPLVVFVFANKNFRESVFMLFRKIKNILTRKRKIETCKKNSTVCDDDEHVEMDKNNNIVEDSDYKEGLEEDENIKPGK